MKKYIIAISLLAFLGTYSCQNNKQDSQNTSVTHQENTQLSAKEFYNKLQSEKNAQIIDVRTPDEFAGGHLEKSINLDYNSGNFKSEVGKLDKSKPYFVYCLSGARSANAADEMRNMGFSRVYEMVGGIMKWRASNLPETTANAPTEKGMTKADFDAAVASNEMVLVDFYADWCEPCKKMAPYLKEISETMPDKVKVLKINVDKNKELVKQLNINALPVLHLYKNNQKIWDKTGFVPKEEVLKQIQ